MLEELIKELTKTLEEKDRTNEIKDDKKMHIKITHGDEVVFDNDTNNAFLVIEDGDNGVLATTYTSSKLINVITMLESVEKLEKQLLSKINEEVMKFLGEN